uniref:Reverse transcriptase Ty1/copia-type domain-containing protein n=1 Tax=Cannabis sativa TaxID=3483 RepID=A0A803PTZ7_CANSA
MMVQQLLRARVTVKEWYTDLLVRRECLKKTFFPSEKSVSVNSNWPLYQLDGENTFFNGDLEEEVYMSPPLRFEKHFGFGNICKLPNSLCGLKQSPKAWFERLGTVLKLQGYIQSHTDDTMFYKHSKDGKVVILIVYVENIVLTGDDVCEFEKMKVKLGEEFEIKT